MNSKLPLFNKAVAAFAPSDGKDARNKEAKIELFDGDSKKFKLFATALDLRFTKYPETYESPYSRIACIAEHCIGRAGGWMTSIVNGERAELLENYFGFIVQFKETFDDAQYLHGMQAQYLERHTTGSVTNFSIRFEEAANACSYNSNVMAPQFLNHLKDEVKKSMNRTPTLDREDYKMVGKLAIEVDNNLFQEQKERSTYQRFPTPSINSLPQRVTSQAQQQFTRSRNTVPRGPLTGEERDRRYNLGLCLYCGSNEHCIDACRLATARPQRQNDRRLNHINHESDNTSHIKDQSD